jgi:hypothetical protein
MSDDSSDDDNEDDANDVMLMVMINQVELLRDRFRSRIWSPLMYNDGTPLIHYVVGGKSDEMLQMFIDESDGGCLALKDLGVDRTVLCYVHRLSQLDMIRPFYRKIDLLVQYRTAVGQHMYVHEYRLCYGLDPNIALRMMKDLPVLPLPRPTIKKRVVQNLYLRMAMIERCGVDMARHFF